MEQKNTISEAIRYIDNAEDILNDPTKANKDNVKKKYQDAKYVRMASHTAWLGVLIAIESLMHKRNYGFPRDVRKNVIHYRNFIQKENKKILLYFNTAYANLHVYGGYDGVLKTTVIEEGLKSAKEIINWCKNQGAE